MRALDGDVQVTGSGAAGEVLLLCHRIPYPPDKGDKIRSYRWLLGLAEHYRVHLGAFVDDPSDWGHAARLRELCGEVCLRPLPALRAKLRGLAALFTPMPLTVACYRDESMARWVLDLLRRRPISRIIVYSSAMAQYAMSPEAGRARRTIDYVDVDADKWRQYAQGGGVPMAWLYAREARCLLAHDVRAAQAFDVSLFVSESETALFRRLTGIHHSVVAVANGIDHAFFAPEPTRPTPFRDGAPALVFTGAMDYRANVDAVRWFISEVWPKVRLRAPTARFYVVGARPGRAVRALAGEDIVVTGRVPDVRPYLQHATAVVAPMRIARGIQNKVLEGMSMGRVVLTTSMGLEGIDAVPGQHLLIADEPTAMADLAEQVLRGRHGGIGAAARELIREHYDWRDALERFLSAVAGDTASEQVCA